MADCKNEGAGLFYMTARPRFKLKVVVILNNKGVWRVMMMILNL